MSWMGWTALGIGCVAIAGVALSAFGRARRDAATQAQMALLDAAAVPAPAGRYDARDIEGPPTRGTAATAGKPYFVGELRSLVYEFAP
ncbi:hypothetical protein [Ramlibacter sp.]|uniref:hypothetical protein n=1 Tax=Ramlibacter sp. TaxID=1917967 RepID=UPI0017E2619F|nr:hypothetical protein [Ramlibacter sp.]MBA2673810.1 hypothetical protein [Ramlibacter sp.]